MADGIRIEGLCAGYGPVQVLDHIDIAVGERETVTLLGANGNGKSTLMKCIMGLCPPREGRIVATVGGVQHADPAVPGLDVADDHSTRQGRRAPRPCC